MVILAQYFVMPYHLWLNTGIPSASLKKHLKYLICLCNICKHRQNYTVYRRLTNTDYCHAATGVILYGDISFSSD